MKRIKFWIRPTTICTVLGLVLGLLDTPKTMVSNGKVIESVSFGPWLGHVLFTMFAGLVLGVVIELIMALVHKFRTTR